MTKLRRNRSLGRIPRYALICLVVFLCCMAVLAILIVQADKLTVLGLTEHVYYLVLVLMGLAAAGFLFGVLPSSATYEGTVLGGTLKLSGAIVGAALVVVGGYFLVPKTFTFPLAVYVHGQGGPQDMVLGNSGRVVLKLGPELRSEPIRDNGQAYFPTIPANFRGQEVPVWVESQDFGVTGAQKRRLTGPSLDLVVQRKSGRVVGRVQDDRGTAVSGAEVRVAGISARTDEAGRFEIIIPGDRMQAELALDVVAPGYTPGRYTIVPDSGEAVLTLTGGR